MIWAILFYICEIKYVAGVFSPLNWRHWLEVDLCIQTKNCRVGVCECIKMILLQWENWFELCIEKQIKYKNLLSPDAIRVNHIVVPIYQNITYSFRIACICFRSIHPPSVIDKCFSVEQVPNKSFYTIFGCCHSDCKYFQGAG